MIYKFLAMFGIVLLLASCETASQKVISGSSSTTSKSADVKKKSSLFASKAATASDKLISVGDRVLFDYDSAELSSDAKLVLDKQSRFLRANPDLTFTIEGHCDERGTRNITSLLVNKEQRQSGIIW